MSTTPSTSPERPRGETFAQAFTARLNNIEERAKAVGSNMTRVCKVTGVARATYERWGHRPPQTIAKVDELEAEVERLEREAAAGQRQAG